MNMRTCIASLLAVLCLAISSAALANSGVTAIYKVSADELWQTIDFHQPSENVMPPIASSTRDGSGIGATKINMLKGGGEVHLMLVYYAPDQRAFNYIIQSSPLPVKNYVGEVRVEALAPNRSRLTWHGTYEPDGASQDKADEVLGGFYKAIATRVGEIHDMESMQSLTQ